ncbi:amidohydrolase family protein [Ihubacter sp. rT4E-8]|uniref:amidohydrolase family protein n=1 Tax=Anaerovoracaceae TaxID=543314 RepID=UPI00203DA8D0
MEKKLAIQCGRLLQPDGTYKDRQTVIVEKNKIREVRDGFIAFADCQIIDAKDKWVTPGLIESHGHLATGNDTNEMTTNPVRPFFSVREAISPIDPAIAKVRGGGFTTYCILPGSEALINGTGVTIKLKDAAVVDEIELAECQPLKLALGDNPKMFMGKKGVSPASRMGNAAVLRQAFYSVKAQLDAGNFDFESAANWQNIPVAEALQGKRLVKIHCHDPRDIVTAVKISEEFGLDYTLEHVTGGRLVAEFLGQHNVRCCLGPLLMNPLKYELETIDPVNPGMLEREGVKFSLIQDASWDTDTLMLPSLAGVCTAYGLSQEAAMRGLTIEAARNLHLEHRIGAVEVGKDADLAVFNGNPLLNTTNCEMTMIDGIIYNYKKEA